jgi:hypothetical protein
MPNPRVMMKTNPSIRDQTQPKLHLEWRWMTERIPPAIKKPAFNFLASFLLMINFSLFT